MHDKKTCKCAEFVTSVHNMQYFFPTVLSPRREALHRGRRCLIDKAEAPSDLNIVCDNSSAEVQERAESCVEVEASLWRGFDGALWRRARHSEKNNRPPPPSDSLITSHSTAAPPCQGTDTSHLSDRESEGKIE